MGLDLEGRIARLESVAFPKGVLSTDDGGISITPSPLITVDGTETPIKVQQGQSIEFAVIGLAPAANGQRMERMYLYSEREDIGAFEYVGEEASARSFIVRGVKSGPAGARTRITVQRSSGLPSLLFFVDVTPIPTVVHPLAASDVPALAPATDG